jgi:hypothetical protein
MAHVSLNFEDAADGQIDFKSLYTGGFDPNSHAHKLANQVIKFLDEQAKSKTQIEVEDVNGICHL